MSTTEERLSRDIETVTGEIIVTDSGLRDARAAVVELVEGRRQRNRRYGVLAAAAAAAAVVGVAGWQALRDLDARPSPADLVPSPAPSGLSTTNAAFLAGDAPTTQLLEGLWRLDNPTADRLLVALTVDGGIGFDNVPGGQPAVAALSSS